jgi:predicted acyl esterase
MAESGAPGVRIQFHHRVPMRDGITLSADIFFPAEADGQARFPVVLLRAPYLKASEDQIGTPLNVAGMRTCGDTRGAGRPATPDGPLGSRRQYNQHAR